jgi:hypothetical protein
MGRSGGEKNLGERGKSDREGTNPCLGIVNPSTSSDNSLYIFLSDGGTVTPFLTENAKP